MSLCFSFPFWWLPSTSSSKVFPHLTCVFPSLLLTLWLCRLDLSSLACLLHRKGLKTYIYSEARAARAEGGSMRTGVQQSDAVWTWNICSGSLCRRLCPQGLRLRSAHSRKGEAQWGVCMRQRAYLQRDCGTLDNFSSSFLLPRHEVRGFTPSHVFAHHGPLQVPKQQGQPTGNESQMNHLDQVNYLVWVFFFFRNTTLTNMSSLSRHIPIISYLLEKLVVT